MGLTVGMPAMPEPLTAALATVVRTLPCSSVDRGITSVVWVWLELEQVLGCVCVLSQPL